MATSIKNQMSEKKAEGSSSTQLAKKGITAIVNSILDSEGLRKRFDELLGKRAPQYISSIITLITASDQLQEAFRNSPTTVIQCGLKAATYDLPIDSSLGYAYIVPFRDKGKMTACFVPGWRGYHQLALRTAMYSKINVTDVRQGELVSYDRLTEDIVIEFVEDEEEREKLPIIGYAGYYRLTNGFTKTIFWSIAKIRHHEEVNRKGNFMTKAWRENFDAMARKTVYRELIGHWGIMSIDYRTEAYKTLSDMAKEDRDIEDVVLNEGEYTITDNGPDGDGIVDPPPTLDDMVEEVDAE